MSRRWWVGMRVASACESGRRAQKGSCRRRWIQCSETPLYGDRNPETRDAKISEASWWYVSEDGRGEAVQQQQGCRLLMEEEEKAWACRAAASASVQSFVLSTTSTTDRHTDRAACDNPPYIHLHAAPHRIPLDGHSYHLTDDSQSSTSTPHVACDTRPSDPRRALVKQAALRAPTYLIAHLGRSCLRHSPPTCPSQCRRLRPSRLPRLRSTSNSLRRRPSSNRPSSNLHTTLRPTSNPRSSHRPQTHPHTPCHLLQRGSDSRPTLDRRRRPTQMAPTMRLRQICPAPAAMATRMRLLPTRRSRHTRPTTSSHHRKHPSTHHSLTRRSKWHGNQRQLLPRRRSSARNSKVLAHHNQTVR